MLDHPLFRLLFDVTANHGWNLTAYMVWFCIIGLPILAIIENRSNKKGKNHDF